jgi:two-component system response regulator YesN
MLGLLLVEDEAAIRQKLVGNTAWDDYGFEPVLSAANGREALEILDAHPEIQIMVTDVQMPKMNGLELIKAVKRRELPLKIVVISGFAEFEYAQESLKLQVAEYLLKPFASYRLLEVVLRLQKELRDEAAARAESESLRRQLYENRSVLQEKLICDLLNGNYVAKNLPAQLNYLELASCSGRPFQVAVFELPENPENSAAFATEEDKYLGNIRLFQQVRQFGAARPGTAWSVNYRRNQVVLVVFDPDAELLPQLEALLAQIGSQLGQALACGLGHPYHDLTELALSYQEAGVALQYRYLYGLNQVFTVNDLDSNQANYQKILYQLHQNPLLNDLKTGADNAVQTDVGQLIGELRQAQLTPELVKIIISNLVLLTFTVLTELGYHPAEILQGDFSILTTIYRTESLPELEQLLHSFFERLNHRIRHKRTSFNEKLIREIRVLLDRNFQDDLSLSGIAGQYQISPGYLSVLFTEFTGKNFIDYLTERRIGKARELLKHTDLKIYEIAGQVGYNDSFYFSNCFKKFSGLSPSEYREKVRRSTS